VQQSYSLPTQCSVVVVQDLLTAATYAAAAAVATGFLQCMNSISSGVCCSSSRGPQFGHFDCTSVCVSASNEILKLKSIWIDEC